MRKHHAELAEIIGTKKIRDLRICRLYCDGHSPKQITEILKERKNITLSVIRVAQIVSVNKAYIAPRIGWDVAKQKNFILSQIHKNPDSKLDPVLLLNQFRTIEQQETDKNNPFKTSGVSIINVFQTVRVEEKEKVADGANQSAVLFGEDFITQMKSRGVSAMN